MSMAMPPDYAPGLPTAPGGGDPTQMGGNAPPRDILSGGAVPSQDGMSGLLAALGQGPGADPSQDPTQGLGGGDPNAPDAGGDGGPTDAIGHIQAAMKHLMMAMTLDQSEGNNLGITKGMGALQGILAGHEKKNQQLSQLGAGPAGGPAGG